MSFYLYIFIWITFVCTKALALGMCLLDFHNFSCMHLEMNRAFMSIALCRGSVK